MYVGQAFSSRNHRHYPYKNAIFKFWYGNCFCHGKCGNPKKLAFRNMVENNFNGSKWVRNDNQVEILPILQRLHPAWNSLQVILTTLLLADYRNKQKWPKEKWKHSIVLEEICLFSQKAKSNQIGMGETHQILKFLWVNMMAAVAPLVPHSRGAHPFEEQHQVTFKFLWLNIWGNPHLLTQLLAEQ